MTIQQIYDLAIKLGITADFRGKSEIAKKLKREKEKFEKLPKDEKTFFDKERLENPFSDTRILLGSPDAQIKNILVGIDIETGEVMLTKKLQENGKKIDLIISHHPAGKALARLDDVIELQTDMLAQLGVPINIAEHLIQLRKGEVFRCICAENHNQAVDAAKLLNIPWLCVHTPADNLVARFLKNKIERTKPEYVEDILKILNSIPEYQEGKKIGAGPSLFAGSQDRKCGKIAFTEITGGTSGHKDIYEKLSHAGVGTIIGMHMSEEYKKEAEKYHINVIIAGHMASDSLGLNLFLDELEKKGIKIIPCSGLIRVSRVKKKKK
ncbi:MAG: NGG1p interacting factor NIF3 [Patescibacteria group bacterium]